MARNRQLNYFLAAFIALGLSASAQAPPSATVIAEIAKQFDRHPLIMLGELHRWEQLHAFIREMLRDREFICRADDVVIEFGNSRLQNIADDYAFGRSVTDAQLESVWRETAVPFGWNSPVYRQLLETIRDLNEKKLCDHKIRIVLGDPPLDWAKIKNVQDYARWIDRDASFADVVEREVLAKHRHAFLLAGQYHVVKHRPEGDDDEPRAAEIIERKHPGALFTIVPAPPAAAAALQLAPAPSFKTVSGSGFERADFSMIATMNPHKKWPPFGEVVDGVLFVGEQTFVYPNPRIYLDPDYQRELRRRIAIIKEFSGQDFGPGLDDLIREAGKAEKNSGK
ncbi:MAG TPA: hypothetical protein VGW57_07025 [Chthoniobacterales bacterium]|nr:hypothetical protein [Chthoniobacterales bacterium]